MVRELYRVLNFLAFLLLAIFFCAIQSSLFRLPLFSWLEIDFILLLAIYVSVYRPLWEASLLILLFSRIAEIHSGSPLGQLSFCYMFVGLIVYFSKETFLFGTPFSTILLSLLGGTLFKASHLLLSYQLGVFSNVWLHVLEFFIPYLLGLSLLSRPVFWIGTWLDLNTFYREQSEAKRLAGEDF